VERTKDGKFVPETVEDYVEMSITVMTDTYMKYPDYESPPSVTLFRDGYLLMMSEKQESYAFLSRHTLHEEIASVRQVADLAEATHFVVVSEGWAVKDEAAKEVLDTTIGYGESGMAHVTLPPSQHPDRIEALCIMAGDRHGERAFRFLEIKRGSGDEKTTLIPMDDRQMPVTHLDIWKSVEDQAREAGVSLTRH